MTYRRPIPPPDMEEIENKYKQELAHIYDLLQEICTFKKVRFDEDSNWTQGNNGYYKLQISCDNFVPLAAFEQNDGASDKRANCVIDTNTKYATVTSTSPFKGYLVVADVDFDDDNALASGSNITVDSSLSTISPNPVANKVITAEINSLKEQVHDVPESLPASDVYAWAKTKKKPMYTWEEICGKPSVVEHLSYNGEELENYNGVVPLDTFAEMLNIPASLSDLITDLSVYDLLNGEDLQEKVASLEESFETLQSNFNEHLEKSEDDFERVYESIDDAKSTLRAEASTRYDSLVNNIAVAKSDTLRELSTHKLENDNHFIDVDRKIEKVKSDLVLENTKTRSDVSNLAAECRRTHDVLHDEITNNTNKIADLYSKIAAPTNTGNMLARLNLLDENFVTLDTRVANNFASLKSGIEENKSKIEEHLTLIDSITTRFAQTDQDIDDINDVVSKFESMVKSNETEINKLKGSSDTNIGVLAAKVDAIVVPTKLSELTNDLELTQVEQSETNGNIKVNGNEIVVFTPEPVAVPTKVSELTNDMNYVTRKQAQGLVASAQVNFDTAFEDDDDANITFVKTVNISNSQGSVIINGDDINLNVEGVPEMQEKIDEQNAIINNQTTIINNLQTIITNLQTTITEMQTNIVNLQNWIGDDNGIIEPEKGEVPLSQKQNASNAVTDEDALTTQDITDAFNDPE